MDREDVAMGERDARRAAEPLVKAAYADGVDAGRQLHYQRNFDEGYRKGFAAGFEDGQQQAHRVLDEERRKRADKMMHYKKGKNVEEDLSKDLIPIEVLPKNFLWMQVKGGTSVSNVVDYATKALEDGSYRSVVWSGSDGGVGKTVSCAEILKRHFEMHQVTRICYRKVEEFWDPQQDGLEQIVATRNIPCVHILLSLDEISSDVAGYQHSKVQTGFWVSEHGHRERLPQAGKAGAAVGNKKGNYFTGPQLKKKVSRSYGDGAKGSSAGNPNPKPKGKKRNGGGAGDATGGSSSGSSGNAADSSRKKGKPKEGDGS